MLGALSPSCRSWAGSYRCVSPPKSPAPPPACVPVPVGPVGRGLRGGLVPGAVPRLAFSPGTSLERKTGFEPTTLPLDKGGGLCPFRSGKYPEARVRPPSFQLVHCGRRRSRSRLLSGRPQAD